jgi:hypothetical protein
VSLLERTTLSYERIRPVVDARRIGEFGGAFVARQALLRFKHVTQLSLLSYAPPERVTFPPDRPAAAKLTLWNAPRFRFSSKVDVRERARSRVCTDCLSGCRTPPLCTHGTRRGADTQKQPTVTRQWTSHRLVRHVWLSPEWTAKANWLR